MENIKETFKEFVARRKLEIKEEVEKLTNKPKLVIINVGDDSASQVYVRGKLKDAAECGIIAELIHYEADIEESVLYDKINELNNNNECTGYIVQLPLPKKFNEAKIIEMIKPEKDVDGFSKLAITSPATPKGIINYLEAQNYDFTDKCAVILGRSNIVGKPLARLLLARNCNVTVIHSKTSEANKRMYLENADLICSAVGKRNIIDETYKLKPTAWIIDIGMNKNDLNKVCGDIEKDLPVTFQSHNPGSTGLTTRLTLLTNLLELYNLSNKA